MIKYFLAVSFLFFSGDALSAIEATRNCGVVESLTVEGKPVTTFSLVGHTVRTFEVLDEDGRRTPLIWDSYLHKKKLCFSGTKKASGAKPIEVVLVHSIQTPTPKDLANSFNEFNFIDE